jgi:hypothetical protein
MAHGILKDAADDIEQRAREQRIASRSACDAAEAAPPSIIEC